MKNLYQEKTANYPRLETDRFFADYENRYKYNGYFEKAFKFVESFQLLREDLWTRFVQQFREDADYEAGWRGEYWGKMMRGACFVYIATKNDELYKVIEKTVYDMLDSEDELGRISSYAVNHEFDGWDIWSRKYVLLGMQYFLEICNDDALKKCVTESMMRQVDYIMSKIGPEEEGKKPITSATRHWRGLNSSSLLEPIVRLYSITGEKRFFDFASYIVACGGTDIGNVFELAYKNELHPYQYPITKAYEMTSCFEGLLEFYRITGEEKYKTAVINYGNRVLESDFTVIGSAGCTHELFDHSTVRQANTTNGEIAQETCVTVTLMKFFWQLLLLTGDSRYADAIEISLYNAYFGAFNTEKVLEPMIKVEHPDWCAEPLPFDSYSPLTAGTRGKGIGGLRVMSDNHYYGCCACIGAAGLGVASKLQVLSTDKGFALSLYVDSSIETSTPSGKKIVFNTVTEYPKEKDVKIKLSLEENEAFELLLRNPSWSKKTKVSVNGESILVSDGYISIERSWSDGDVIELELDMRTEAIRPIPYGVQTIQEVIWGKNIMEPLEDREDPIAHKHIALRRGPVMLAQENRLGYSVDVPIDVKVNDDGFVDVELTENTASPYECIFAARVPLTDGSFITVTDYASAGKLWTDESKMAVWMLTK